MKERLSKFYYTISDRYTWKSSIFFCLIIIYFMYRGKMICYQGVLAWRFSTGASLLSIFILDVLIYGICGFSYLKWMFQKGNLIVGWLIELFCCRGRDWETTKYRWSEETPLRGWQLVIGPSIREWTQQIWKFIGVFWGSVGYFMLFLISPLLIVVILLIFKIIDQFSNVKSSKFPTKILSKK